MAVKTKAQILSEISTLLADNTTGNISAQDVRTVVNDITDSYEDLITAGTTSQYWRGDKTWQTLPILEANGTLTSSQINDLDTIPIQLIAAPGANKLILVENATFYYIASSTGFGSGICDLKYGTEGTEITRFNISAELNSTTSKIFNLYPANLYSSPTQNTSLATTAINDSIKISAENSASGNGSIKYSIKYRIVSL